MKLQKYLDANLILNYLFIVYAFLIPLNLPIYRFVAILIGVFFIFQKDIKEKLKWIFNNRFFQIFVIYIFYQYLVILWTPDKTYGIKFVNKYIEYFIFIFIIASSIKKEFISKVIYAFIAGVFVTEIIAYGIFFNLWQTNYSKSHYPDISPFYHHTIYSIFLSTAILISLYKILHTKFSFINLITLFFTITMTINLFLNGGRGGQIAFILTLFFILFLKIKENKKLIFLLFIPLIILFLAYKYSPMFYERVNLALNDIKNISNMNFCGSWGNRVGSYIVSFEILKHHLLFGVGFKEPLNLLPQIINNKFSYLKCIISSQTIHLHSSFLMEITQTGLIGFVLLLAILIYLVKLKIEDNFLKFVKTIFLINFIVFSIIDYSWHMAIMMKYFALFSGILLSSIRFSTYYETNNTQKDNV